MYNVNFEIGLKVPASGAYFTGSQIKLHFHLIGRLCECRRRDQMLSLRPLAPGLFGGVCNGLNNSRWVCVRLGTIFGILLSITAIGFIFSVEFWFFWGPWDKQMESFAVAQSSELMARQASDPATHLLKRWDGGSGFWDVAANTWSHQGNWRRLWCGQNAGSS